MSGFSYEERDGILMCYFSDFRRDSAEEWAEVMLKNMEHHNQDQTHFRVLAQVDKAALPTPYASAKALAVAQARKPTLAVSVAMVSYSNAIVNILRFVINKVPRTDYIYFFKDDASALTWLADRHQNYLSAERGIDK
ncbi:MAG: hypothetical protein KC708_09430 [Anaerolineae bacterium]|nr:hypothetical protein [Anaerolineae bacterium]